ncbi:WD40 repeat domain-containing protein [Nonomuraea sp. NPDC052116]|uniref:WD40 repeat domain-containing protein n=1 Tax=Nonomuraea sp. NPDC052116 TaxID=3155665 RepID=UPI0034235BB9
MVIHSPLLRGVLIVSLLLTTVAATPASAQQFIDSDVDVPEADVILHEQDGDPWRVTAFSKAVSESRSAAYLRSPDGISFVEKKGYSQLEPAPKGGRVAAIPYSSPGAYNSVVIFDSAGKAKRIRTVRKPLKATVPEWTRDGRKLVLSIQKNGINTTGFVIIDAVTGTSKAVAVRNIDPASSFQWTPDGKYLAVGIWESDVGVRVYRQDGRTLRTLHKIGWMQGSDAFSPSGKQLLTLCYATTGSHYCLWDFKTGKLVKRVTYTGMQLTIGWWDDQHLFYEGSHSEGSQGAVVIDLNGKITRVAASYTEKAQWVGLVYTRRHSSA